MTQKPEAGTRSTMASGGIRKYVSRDGKTPTYTARVAAYSETAGKMIATQKTFPTLKAAQEWRDAQRNARGTGSFVFPDKGTVGEYLDVYLTRL